MAGQAHSSPAPRAPPSLCTCSAVLWWPSQPVQAPREEALSSSPSAVGDVLSAAPDGSSIVLGMLPTYFLSICCV